MPPVARAAPIEVAGPAEQELLAHIDQREWSIAEFSRRIAERTGKRPDSEKSALYRILKEGGTWTSAEQKKRRIYAELLERPDASWLKPPDRLAGDGDGWAALVEEVRQLNERVRVLVGLIEKQVRRFPPAVDEDL